MRYLGFMARHPRLLLFGFLLAFASSFGQTFFIALFGADLRAEHGLTHGGFGALYSGATFVSGVGLLWAGGAVDRFDLRNFTLLVAAGLVTACLLMATAPTAAVMAIAILLLRFTGQGLLSHVAITTMARSFEGGPGGTRGKAISLAALGHPAGEALLPAVAVALIAGVGWREAWLAVAAFVAVGVVPAVAIILHRRRELGAAPTPAAGGADDPATRHWTRREVLRDPRFYFKLPMVLALPFIATGVFFHQAHIAEVKGWTLGTFAEGFAIFAVAATASGVAAGPLVDRFGGLRLMPWLLTPLAAGLVTLASSDAPLALYAFMTLAGVTQGLVGTAVQAMWAERYGVRHLGAIRSLAQALAVISTSGSPVLLGALIDVGVTVDTLAAAMAAYVGLAIALVVPVTRRP